MLINRLLRGRPTAIRFLATVWLLTLFILLALAVYGFLARFIPSDRYLELANVPAWIAATVVFATGILFYPLAGMRSPRVRDKVRQWATALVCSALIPYVLWCGLTMGAPALAHEFAPARDATRSFTVQARAPRYGIRFRRMCAGRLHLQSNYFLLPIKACGIPEREWRHATVDDKVSLEGPESWFGLSYSIARVIDES